MTDSDLNVLAVMSTAMLTNAFSSYQTMSFQQDNHHDDSSSAVADIQERVASHGDIGAAPVAPILIHLSCLRSSKHRTAFESSLRNPTDHACALLILRVWLVFMSILFIGIIVAFSTGVCMHYDGSVRYRC